MDRYHCDEPGCGKSFSRSDHLARHKVNHSPQVLFRCRRTGCGKEFVRKDVREKHELRHKLKLEKIRRRSESGLLSSNKENDTTSIDSASSKNESSKFVVGQNRTTGTSPATNNYSDGNGFSSTAIPTNEEPTTSSYLNDNLNQNLMVSEASDQLRYDAIPEISKETVATFVPTDLTQWLFNEEALLSQSNNSSPSNNFLNHLDFHAERMLEDAFGMSPNFPLANYQTSVDDGIVQKLILLIPELKHQPFGVLQIERCLEIYWSICHVQFPILHKPSFSTNTAHPLLLLCIIMMGAGLAALTGVNESEILNTPQVLADTIAVPLRWLILSSDDFCSPPKAWIIQSLIILETYEILLSTRKLHERAYLHHGLKIQLLRRSPLLGGDPLNQSSDYKELTEGTDVWKSWIEVESLKRAALVSFYLDTVHATIFGHEIILFAHQIKLLMPCDDMLWEMSNIDKNNLPPQTETPRFITALTRLLHQENFEVGSLSKKILLAGLLTIKVQMEQKDLQVTFMDWKPIKESWKDTIYRAIEVWREDICHENCCDARNSFYLSSSKTSELVPRALSIVDTQCKFPIYHLSQTFMRIKQYDCIIYAGASNRMSVKTTDRDLRVVKERIGAWANSFSGQISVIHCYLFLYEMLFRGEERLYYNPATDPLFHRPNIVALALFVIWAYNYNICGPESADFTIYQSNKDSDQISPPPFKEDGYLYLKRIIENLNSGTYNSQVSNNLINDYSELLPEIENKHYLVGFLSLFMQNFKICQSEVCKEYGGLLENCIEKSLGKKYV